jgi:hypothetical protein
MLQQFLEYPAQTSRIQRRVYYLQEYQIIPLPSLSGKKPLLLLALLVRELSVFAESKAGLVKKARKVPWYSHVDRSLVGNLYQFMADFEGELDEIETDMVSMVTGHRLPRSARRLRLCNSQIIQLTPCKGGVS